MTQIQHLSASPAASANARPGRFIPEAAPVTRYQNRKVIKALRAGKFDRAAYGDKPAKKSLERYLKKNSRLKSESTATRVQYATTAMMRAAAALHIPKSKLAQFTQGFQVELEHGKKDPSTDVTHDDPIKTGKIAKAHLKEIPNYYTRLKKMEKSAKKESFKGDFKSFVNEINHTKHLFKLMTKAAAGGYGPTSQTNKKYRKATDVKRKLANRAWQRAKPRAVAQQENVEEKAAQGQLGWARKQIKQQQIRKAKKKKNESFRDAMQSFVNEIDNNRAYRSFTKARAAGKHGTPGSKKFGQSVRVTTRLARREALKK